jgi:lysophospholipase L1-like esterase
MKKMPTMRRNTIQNCCLFIASVLLIAQRGYATDGKTHWVGTWTAAMTPLQPPLSPVIPTSYSNVTIRDIVHLSLGGSQVRFTLSNEFGPGPLDIGGVHAGLSRGDGAIAAGSDRTITFGKRESVRIPAGAVAVSDPLPLNLAAFSDLAISIYIPADETADHLSYHALAMSTNYVAEGNALSSLSMTDAKPMASWIILKCVEVQGDPEASAVVALGDSITDGVHSTPNKNTRWPNILAERLHANKTTANISVLDAGISGNRLFSLGNPPVGQDALGRFDRDVLGQSGLKYLIVVEGINDIGRAGKPLKPDDSTDAATLIWALQQLAIRAHAHGLKIFVATLSPYTGFSYYYSAHGEEMRQSVNAFIRHSSDFDAVLDFDQVLRDPGKPDTLKAAYDSGDHLHPNDAGYKAMADAVDLSLIR